MLLAHFFETAEDRRAKRSAPLLCGALLTMSVAACAEAPAHEATQGALGGAGGAVAPPVAGTSGQAAVTANGGSTSKAGGSSGEVEHGGAGSGGAESGGGPALIGGAAGSGGGGAAVAGGKVLMIGGDMPGVGVDLQLHQVLDSLGLEVEDVREAAVKPEQATGKRLVVLSYSMSSTEFDAEAWATVPVPVLVLEHFLLPRLSMTSAEGHGFEPDVVDLEVTSDDPELAAGFEQGAVTVYSQVGEFFWGIPGPGAITAATVKGNPERAVTFGYPAGSMMVGMAAPAKRVQLFVAVHAPPANPSEFLNDNGLKLFAGAVSWAIK